MKLIDKIIINSKIIDEEHLDKYLNSTWYSSDKKCINKWICSFVIITNLVYITIFCCIFSYVLLLINITYITSLYNNCVDDCCIKSKDPDSNEIPEEYYIDCNKNDTLTSLCENNCNSKKNLAPTSYRSFITQSLYITFCMVIVLCVMVVMMHRYIKKLIIKYIKEITDQEKALLDKTLIKGIIPGVGDYGCGGGGN